MKNLLLTSLLVVIVFITQAQSIRDFSLKNLEGELVRYNAIKGEKLTMIDFWASWCKPCMKAMPKLDALYEKYMDQGVTLISLNTDGPRSVSKVKPLVKALRLRCMVLYDTNKDVSRDMEVTQMPTFLLVDANNKIVYRHEGFSMGDEYEIEEVINKYLSRQ